MARLLYPLNDAVIVKLAKPKEQSEGGIIIHSSYYEQPNTGRVVAVGPGLRTITSSGEAQILEPTVQVDDEVLLVDPKLAKEIEWGGENLYVTTESNIVGTIRNSET